MARIRIGDMLVKAGLIDEMQLQAALAQQKQWGGRIGDILVDKGFLDEMMLWRGLSKQLGVTLVSLPALTIPRDLALFLPAELCEKHDIFPVGREERTLTVASSNPNNVGGLDEVSFRLGLKVKVVLAPQREIDWAVRHYLKGDNSACPPPRARFRPELAGEMRIVQSEQLVPGAPATTREPAPSGFSQTPSFVAAPTAPGLPPTWQPTLPGGAPPMRAPSIQSFRPATETPTAQPPGSEAEASLREATGLLKTVIEVCVAKGIFTREEYIERLKRLG